MGSATTKRSRVMSLEGAISSPQDGTYAIDPLHDPRWPEFIGRHPSASVFHTRGWLQALRMTYGYQPVAFTMSAPSEALTNALLFCKVRSWLTGHRLVSLPFSDHCEPLLEHREQFGRLSACVERVRSEERWKYVEMRSANSLVDFDLTFRKVTTYCLHRLDLRPGLNELYKGFHKDCIQRKISRAEREALSYEAGRSDSLLLQFYGLLQLTRSRHHLPAQPIEWFRNLLAYMGKNVCIRIVSKSSQPVAGILTISHGKKVVYKYGASHTQFNRFGGMPLLFWKTINESKQAGAEELDFGRSDLDQPGLIAFKGRWAAQGCVLTTWRAPLMLASPRRERLKSRCTSEVFSRLPDCLSVLAGRLLYRHFG